MQAKFFCPITLKVWQGEISEADLKKIKARMNGYPPRLSPEAASKHEASQRELEQGYQKSEPQKSPTEKKRKKKKG